ncbi:hypothetical protein BRETT_004254 [Brettanomyces bruxellensis]|uniref:Ribosomal protein L9 domain-containing protein n=1 Tax=Dekkera bruxellensis TaxID=5007 RepID=A0A871QZJ6_DEKBR|nr:uncharacterized protein BRETT_004254 [Brettanomyces bruxellensis]QOU19033.1 hypothetical protein BRETT_004254 [Brettanomyces bruxellensis]
MFLRSNTCVLKSIRSEGRKFGVRYTAQSKKKRIAVQLLDSFAGIGITGQIVHVKASTMMNKLHRGNGAVYLNYEGAKPRITVIDPKKIQARRMKELRAANIKPEQIVAEGPDISVEEKKEMKEMRVKKEKKENKPEKLLSLDELIGLDLAEVSEEDRDKVVDAMPKKITLKRYTKDGAIDPALSVPKIASSLENIVRKSLGHKKLQDAVSQFFNQEKIKLVLRPAAVQDETGEVANTIRSIKKTGSYTLSVEENGRQLTEIIIRVVDREH